MKILVLILLGFLSLMLPQWGRADPATPVVWGATVHVADAGWGRMIPLGGQKWLSVGTLYPSQTTNTLQIKLSVDNARSFSAISEVTESGRRMDNGELIRLPTGMLLLSGRSVIENRSFHLPVYQSRDNGAHWLFLSMIDSNDSPVNGNHPSQGLWEPHFFLLPRGRVAVAYANEKYAVDVPAYSQICAEKVSADNGATWGPEIRMVAQPGGGALRPGMPVVAAMRDGRFCEVCEVVGIDNAAVFFKVSPDGIHWPEGLGTAIALQHAGPYITSLSDGCLLVSSCSNEMAWSGDNGQTWQRVDPPAWPIGFHLSFPAIYQTGPAEIAVMNTQGGVNIRFGALVPVPPHSRRP